MRDWYRGRLCSQGTFHAQARIGAEFVCRDAVGAVSVQGGDMGATFMHREGTGAAFVHREDIGAVFVSKEGIGAAFVCREGIGAVFVHGEDTGATFMRRKDIGAPFMLPGNIGAVFLCIWHKPGVADGPQGAWGCRRFQGCQGCVSDTVPGRDRRHCPGLLWAGRSLAACSQPLLPRKTTSCDRAKQEIILSAQITALCAGTALRNSRGDTARVIAV